MRGFEIANLWGSDETHRFPDNGGPSSYRNFFPPIGGYRFLMFSVPPDNVGTETNSEDVDQVGDMERLMPGALATFDLEVPGMHRSATVDLLYVIEGSCELELDDGARIELNQGDSLVQSGTMHAWRNPNQDMCRIIAVTVGAQQS